MSVTSTNIVKGNNSIDLFYMNTTMGPTNSVAQVLV